MDTLTLTAPSSPSPMVCTTGTLPTRELAKYANLPAEVRLEAMRWHELFTELEARVKRGEVTQEEGLHDVAGQVGRPFKTVRRIFFDKWRAGGRKWFACVNRVKAGSKRDAAKNDPAFVEWWVRKAGQFQRNTRAAHSSFISLWKAGHKIPGLDNSLSRKVPPPGCGYANLCRLLQSHEQAIAAQRRGLEAMKARGPLVLTTRAGLWCGSHVVIDDMWHDYFVMFQGQLVRVLQLSALDVFSGNLTAWGCKPRFQRADGTFDGLKERQARLLVLDHLARHGYSPRGTEFLAEHGTAAISEALEAGLARWSDGRIKVSRSGIVGQAQALLGLSGEGRGNFRFKTWLESWHNLLHNELAALPAQTGLSVDRRPEFTAGLLKADSDLARSALWLAKRNPEAAQHLLSRTLHYHGHFLPLLDRVIESINSRGEDPDVWSHSLEGWHALGHVVNEFRLRADDDRWLSDGDLLTLAPAMREAVLQLAANERGLARERKLSPREVWTPGRRELVKLPEVALAELLGDDYGREVRVDRMSLVFQDAEIAPEPLQFESRVFTAEGLEEELPSNETVWLTVNPFNLSRAYVWDAKRRYLGSVKRDARICRTEQDAVQEQFKRVATRTADVLAGVKRAHASELREETRRLQHNTDLLAPQLKAEGIRTPRELRAEQREQERAAQAVSASIPEVDIGALVRQRAEQFTPEPEVAWEG